MIVIKRKSDYLIVFIGALIVFLLSYFIIQSILYSLLTSFASIVLLIKINKSKKEKNKFLKRIDDMNNFVILINTTMINEKDLYEAYQIVENNLSSDFLNIGKEDFLEHIYQIALDYNFECFKSYAIDMKNYSHNEDYNIHVNKTTSLCLKYKKYTLYNIRKKEDFMKQINYLYMLSFALIILIRVFIPIYYEDMINQPIYQFILFILLLIVIILYFIIYNKHLFVKIKGI